jgi:hypothetical protein
MLKAFAAIVPDDAEPSGVANEIVKVVDMPSESARSGFITIRLRTAPMPASQCSIAFAPRCCIVSA